MKKIFYSAIVILLAACNSSNVQSNEEVKEKSEDPISQENKKVESSMADMLLGTWEFTDPKIKVTQIITYKEDGTYQLLMGQMEIDGQWELNENILISKSRPDAPGQKKTIKELTSKKLTVLWERPGAESKELTYLRKES